LTCALPAYADDAIDFQVVRLPKTVYSGYRVIRNINQWKSLASDATAPVVSSAIDFDRYTLLTAENGSKPTSGFALLFREIRNDPEPNKPSITAYLVELQPGSCPRLTELTHPTASVLIPKTDKSIRFVLTKAVSDCNTRAVVSYESR
jgi:hypothetical protein